MESILIIEDDADILELLTYNLARDGYHVHSAKNGETGLKEAVRLVPSLILLDLMLPGIQGMEVCRRLKQRPETSAIPLIMMTAKGEESDVVLGLEMGADDYVVKPFSPKELLARIRAVLRRASGEGRGEYAQAIRLGDVLIDSWRHEVRVGGEAVPFTLTEFRLLQALASNPGRVFTRDQLLERITEGKSFIIDRNIDVHIRSIRLKLKTDRDRIVTVRGLGYKCQE
jgi:DNA-binding response OmpR family regulator